MTVTAKIKKGESGRVQRRRDDPRVHRGRHLLHGRLRDAREGLGLSTSPPDQITVDEPPSARLPPGSRSAGDDLYPQTGNGGYDAEHYDIELDL